MDIRFKLKSKATRIKRRLSLRCCRAEQKLLDVFCNTPEAITPRFVLVLQTYYTQWRIDALLQKIYQESRDKWKEAYPDKQDRG